MKFINGYKKVLSVLNRVIPLYTLLPVAFVWLNNGILYSLGQTITSDSVKQILNLPVDSYISFVPQFIWVYVLAYPVWVIVYIMVGLNGKEYAYRFYTVDVLVRFISFLFFVLMPTTIARPEFVDSGISEKAVGMMYYIDDPSNLFPSLHCVASWMCFLAVFKKPRFPKWAQAGVFVIAVAICMSTVFIKQHNFIDVVGGILLAQVGYMLKDYIYIDKYFAVPFEWLNKKLLLNYNLNEMNE